MMELIVKEITEKTIQSPSTDLLYRAMDVTEFSKMNVGEVADVQRDLKSVLGEMSIDFAKELKNQLPEHLQELLQYDDVTENLKEGGRYSHNVDEQANTDGVDKTSKIRESIETRYEAGFDPVVGAKYGTDGGPKVLQLGDSHYCADIRDAHAGMTKEIIQDLLDPNSPHEAYKNTYTKSERAISGNLQSNLDQRKDFYERTAFYNYVQEPMTGARVAPTKEQFERSSEKFLETLEKLQPDQIVVWGNRLYDNMTSKNAIERPPLVVDGKTYQRCAYQLENGKAVEVLCLPHPSTAYSPEAMNKVYKEFVRTINE